MKLHDIQLTSFNEEGMCICLNCTHLYEIDCKIEECKCCTIGDEIKLPELIINDKNN